MKYILSSVDPDWDNFDLDEEDTQTIRDYHRLESLGGGPIASSKGVAYEGEEGIFTPIFEELDFEDNVEKMVNSKDLFNIPELRHSLGAQKYTNLWILDHNDDSEASRAL